MRFLLFVLLIAPGVASATQVLAVDLPDIAGESDAVVWAAVTGIVVEEVPEEPRRTHTRVAIRVLEWLGGREGKATTLEISLPGGRIGRYAQLIPGTPTLHVGDEIVVALERGRDQRHRIVGFHQGLWAVTRAATGPVVATSDRRGAELIQRHGDGRLRTTPVPALDTRPLEQLLAELRALLAASPR